MNNGFGLGLKIAWADVSDQNDRNACIWSTLKVHPKWSSIPGADDQFDRNRHLERNTVVLGGVRFLGCTLQTGYALRSMFSPEHVMKEIQQRLTDHYQISTDTGLFTPHDALALHMTLQQWLSEELAKPYEGKP